MKKSLLAAAALMSLFLAACDKHDAAPAASEAPVASEVSAPVEASAPAAEVSSAPVEASAPVVEASAPVVASETTTTEVITTEASVPDAK
ncbi:hypothetical protein PT286_03205 [Neisseriaceae bacterium ESL0693]|nr:hypothetical protein [Neisseriaceae bacterium ESL0693]